VTRADRSAVHPVGHVDALVDDLLNALGTNGRR
jgi:hypothetical protein